VEDGLDELAEFLVGGGEGGQGGFAFGVGAETQVGVPVEDVADEAVSLQFLEEVVLFLLRGEG
jgi:hypothetical protein